MSQDTRKDPRAKIVSLNVRYKSATVDEFIENHSHDVSRGGLFIKTSTPFAQGTLLKFEIRLSSDQPVIAGVGRVVWKREPNQAATDRPAGMGVKFIKIDDRSRSLIERLVTTKQDAGAAFNKQDEEVTTVRPNSTPPRVDLQSIKPTVSGMPAMSAKGEVVPSTPPTGPMPSNPSFTNELASAAATAAGGSSFFPKTGGEQDMPPPQERTMMRQAAELLEEALKASGGSMEEVEQNPLFNGINSPHNNGTNPALAATAPMPAASAPPVASAPPAEPAPAALALPSHKATVVGMAPTLPQQEEEEPIATIGGFPTSTPGAPAVVTPAAAALAAQTTESTRRSVPPGERRPGSNPPPRMSEPPARTGSGRPVRATDLIADSAPKKGGGGIIWAGLAVIAIGGGLAYAYQAGMLNELAKQPAPAETAPHAAPPATTAAATTATAAPTTTTEPTASVTASATASAAPTTSASTSAAAAAAKTPPPTDSAVAAKTPEAKPPPTPPVKKAAPKPAETKTSETAAETTEPKPVETKPAETKSAETPSDGETKPPPAKKPAAKPAAKPKEDSDNPY